MRAVAAISMGRTGVKDEAIIDKLIGMTKDGDRIVRQSVCLTLGSMKAIKAIPYISNLWQVPAINRHSVLFLAIIDTVALAFIA